MKPAIVICVAAGVGILSYYVISRKDKTHRSDTTYSSQPSQPPDSTLTDSAEVFKKAFWKRPTADDKILHAERREWFDDDGVEKWQWFLAVEPSPALVKYLREDNAFSLAPAATIPVVKDSPTWFAFQDEDVEILQAPHGQMRLIFSKTKPLLLATDSGGGFHPGAPEQANPAQGVQPSTGRIPLTPPPASTGE
jgi:hypothetical protein